MAEVVEKEVSQSSTDVTVTTTTETVVISASVRIPTHTARVLVKAKAQMTTGAAATTVTPRIRDGNTTGGTLRNEANAETLKAAAGGIETFEAEAVVQLANVDQYEACLTLQQASATGNGTVRQAIIELEVLGG